MLPITAGYEDPRLHEIPSSHGGEYEAQNGMYCRAIKNVNKTRKRKITTGNLNDIVVKHIQPEKSQGRWKRET
jgi:hypothetical protein